MPKAKRILFLVPYPLSRAPSQRFRVELFLPILREHDISYRIEPFLDEATWTVLYSQSSLLKKAIGVVKGFLRRFYVLLFVVPAYSYVFVHREATPIGPPIFEFAISKMWRKRLVYDFDDAIWIPNTSQENRMISWIKAFWKVKYICRWSYKVVGGNEYLCSYARQYNENVVLIPTCVNAVEQHNTLKMQHTSKVVIGWTGSHSTMGFLESLVPVLRSVAENYNSDIVVISNHAPAFLIPRLHFIPWNEETEIQDLLKLNIGIMPLEHDPWCEGKCGFKIIQYLALGIPAVASPVGVNNQIIDRTNGFLCTTSEEWYNALVTLLQNASLRTEMGYNGRQKIIKYYSLQANEDTFLNLFD